MRLSTPEASGNAATPGLNKRVLQAGIAGLSVLALGSLLWLNGRVDRASEAETKLLPATLVTPRESQPAKAPLAPNAASGAAAANEARIGGASRAPATLQPTAADVAPAGSRNPNRPLLAPAPTKAAAIGINPLRSSRRAAQAQRVAAEPPAAPATGEVSTASVAPKTAAASSSVEAGADLGVLQRGTRARIDVENPY